MGCRVAAAVAVAAATAAAAAAGDVARMGYQWRVCFIRDCHCAPISLVPGTFVECSSVVVLVVACGGGGGRWRRRRR